MACNGISDVDEQNEIQFQTFEEFLDWLTSTMETLEIELLSQVTAHYDPLPERVTCH